MADALVLGETQMHSHLAHPTQLWGSLGPACVTAVSLTPSLTLCLAQSYLTPDRKLFPQSIHLLGRPRVRRGLDSGALGK